ncbi:hypothetical protein BKA00_003062 [Actinomadura coerulea]|uniref:DUF7824 domain-containing protein n=1 Tax=Actinomadura coerulea TaxID=46159 RepID=A0A7X0FYM4_9ACTN|nr:DUF6493 family protein [Actinomadura coerulea]MBB6396148.1 hypothetical protein [Actinomadura coerulea]GGQ38466.1 hypothetical protein GCM10010187_65320 [Actinomadura coerulea]
MSARGDDLQKALDAGDVRLTARLVAELDDDARRAVAKDLPDRLKAMRAAAPHGALPHKTLEPLLVAGAGTVGGPAAAAAWLCRRELRLWWTQNGHAQTCAALCAVTSAHPDEWRADVAHRVAARIRVSEGESILWHMAAALAESAGTVPDSDGFVVGWVTERDLPGADDPFLDALVPKLFEVNAVGGALAEDEASPQWKSVRKGTWAGALSGMAATGRLDRALLLDGCVRRFLRGGTVRDLRWFIALHDALEPTEEDTAARARDYVRLLPAAPSTVAGLALRQVRRVDDGGGLDAALFDEAADAVLFRPEKKLVQAALTWLDRTARKRDRVDATLRAVTAVFGSDALDLRERAVAVAARHAGHAGGAVREEVRAAARDLPAVLREPVAAAFGAVEAAAAPEPLPGPPPFTPREAPAAIGTLGELAEEFAVLLRADEEWRTSERFLAALVEFAYRDPEATRAALRKPADDLASWLTDADSHSSWRVYIRESWIEFPVQSLLRPAKSHGLAEALASLLNGRSRKAGTVFHPQMERFLTLRRHEIASAVGKAPVLLATPTEGSGHVDPGVLVARLERIEAAGAEPGRADLMQAMLRVPREIDPAAAARARRLASKAGRTLAAWLADGGLTDPAVECAVLDKPLASVRGRTIRPPTRILSTVDAPGDSDIAHLCAFPEEGWTDFGTAGIRSAQAFWPSILPSHREVAAAHLVPHLAGAAEDDLGQGAVMLDLAGADGPTGAATGTLLACALAHRSQNERADAVESLLVLAARGDLPAAETGTALGRLAALKRLTLPRAVKALTAAADGGGHAGVWAILAAALPHTLPAPGERAVTGVPDLIALATRLAETTGAKDAVPGLEDVAARGGSSRLVKESARLHRALAT